MGRMGDRRGRKAKGGSGKPGCHGHGFGADLPTADTTLITKLKAVDDWERDGYLTKAGWVTFPGNAKPDGDVAKECLNLLKKSLKLE